MHSGPDFDIADIPFSRFGSYLTISDVDRDGPGRSKLTEGIWLRCVHGDSAYEVIRFELLDDGAVVAPTVETTAGALTLRASGGRVEFCMPTQDTVRIRVTHCTLRMTVTTFRNHGAIKEPDGNWILNLAKMFRFFRLIPLAGGFEMDAPWTTKRCEHMVAELSASGDTSAELAIEELTWMRPALEHARSFDDAACEAQTSFDAFCAPLLECPEPLRDAARRAAYLDWSSVVHPHRLLTRPAMYMSKNWMTNVWAWDHAFNALAVSLTDVDLAWDQFMVIFDHQNESGQIPDFINDVRYLTCFVKPPIHGWILSRMIDFAGPLPPARLAEAYDRLSRWTDWWLRFRDPDGDGLPVYWHGNDSGWDNGTVFDVQLPLKAPELAAFLILQMDVLSDFANQLGRGDEAKEWRRRADATLSALIETLWDGTRFRCISAVTREAASPSDSVFGCLPIVLGKRLPLEIRSALATEIKRHLTEWGPATEHPDSPAYEPNGYWRGPIWAPPTMILVDGLRSAGETELTQEIAARFCTLCATSGFAENFDALSGEALCDRGYTWTSSVFLVLANKYM